VALTAAGAALTRANQAAQLAARARSLQGLLALWRIVDVTDLKGTIDTFARAAALLAGEGFAQSAVSAANYYSLFRRVEGIGALIVPAAVPPPAEAIIGDLRGAALKGIIDGRRAGMNVDRAKANGLVRVSGALTKQVLAGGRMTITGAVIDDRKALGWARVTAGEPCAFCRALAARGPVYKSERTADFQAHDHDACVPEPVYEGTPGKTGAPAAAAAYADEFRTAQAWARTSGTMSQDTSNNALNNYRRWLDNGRPEPGQTTAPSAGNDGGNPGGN